MPLEHCDEFINRLIRNGEGALILNSSPFIALCQEVGQCGLLLEVFKALKSLGAKVLVPTSVISEFSGSEIRDLLNDLVNEGLISVVNVDEGINTLRGALRGLGDGELGVLALARSIRHENTLCILDDKRARRYAEDLCNLYTGTLGILYIASKLNIRSKKEIYAICINFSKTKFYIEKPLCEKLVKR